MTTTSLESPSTKQTLASTLAKTWLKQYFDDSNFPEWTKSRPGITSSLLLPERDVDGDFGKERDTRCLLCEKSFLLPRREKDFLRHLLENHDFVIGDVNMISDLPEYVDYWRRKLENGNDLKDFCSVMKAKLESDLEKKKEFYFLSDVLQEDKEIRKFLQIRKLQQVLRVQEKERHDPDFSRSCLFCRMTCKSAKELFNHMAFSHNFSVGQPDNLVFVDELLDELEKRLEDLICIYCEKTFKNRDVLKEHMRKKSHKKINPKNAAYDKFYVVNYLEFGQKWRRSESAFEDELPTGFEENDDDGEGEDVDNDWSDWRDASGAVCLFCSAIYRDVEDLFGHLSQIHRFDYQSLKRDLNLSFYQQIKLINFIRRRVYLNTCPCCGLNFKSKEEMLEHAEMEDHLKPPQDESEWDQSQYFFPTYENDHLLSTLDPGDDGDAPVVPEDVDVQVKDSILNEKEFRNSLVSKNRGKVTMFSDVS